VQFDEKLTMAILLSTSVMVNPKIRQIFSFEVVIYKNFDETCQAKKIITITFWDKREK
jgi:hypothetical protein